MDNFLLVAAADTVWIQLILLFIGISLMIIAFFKQNDDTLNPKLEKILDDFTTQMALENEDIFKKIKDSEGKIFQRYEDIIKDLEARIEKLENSMKEDKNSTQMLNRYEQVLEFFQAGDSIEEIAEKTKLGYAEIKLMIELSKKGLKYV